jgi:AcrR family transcriptional regulator
MARRALKPGELPTSETLVARAAVWFGERGFDGGSLRELGAELGVTAPTLLHHVGSKQKLYARVLAHVAGDLAAAYAARAAGDDEDQISALVDAYLAWSRQNEAYARLLMRELLDNRERAANGKYWPLAGIVKTVTAQVRRVRGGSEIDAAMVVFQAIGAIAYFAAAEPTLRKILDLGPKTDLAAPFRVSMHRALRAGLARRTTA